MSATALCLIRCRRLSTANQGLKKTLFWGNIKKIAKVTGAVVLGGCVFITYEVVALNRAVTINTQAILQEKRKSYIYLNTNTQKEQENLASELTYKTRKELHKAARRFLEISSKILLKPLDDKWQPVPFASPTSLLPLITCAKSVSPDPITERETAVNTMRVISTEPRVCGARDLRRTPCRGETYAQEAVADTRTSVKNTNPPTPDSIKQRQPCHTSTDSRVTVKVKQRVFHRPLRLGEPLGLKFEPARPEPFCCPSAGLQICRSPWILRSSK
ncbi:hypothetical protein SKAU_G00185320 [Synaphobranchus kaupii]|uniref:Uncharacterized protein n=1 Tax=Synaphobranchus kaupii TaxID=118154 RepID=A0A9Q1FCZ0_SYNKA|nr:hypothetical protein SKAU_G00185320 [Synaphobranchus kaupii]